MKTSSIAFLIIYFIQNASTQTTQSIKGHIIDAQSGQSIPFANVIALQGENQTGGVSDMEGYFEIEKLPIGRYDIKVSYIGYKELMIPDVLVRSHQPTELYLSLEETPFDLSEVRVKPVIDKKKVKSDLALVSGRLLSMEEANRYAGGFDDPARLASAFAGVSSAIQSNGIAIRGNSPKYLQWKMEGIEIPNPNHFADLSAFGGGGLTALSSQVMDDTDFLTGAMPANYENALSGVFDLSMRKGHSHEREHQIQVGIIGIDLASEGKFSDSSRSTYLLNYRYSTLGLIQPLLPADAGKISYQDLSFKLSFPDLKKGTIEWWGLGLHDFSGQEAILNREDQLYEQDLLEQRVKQNMVATGLKYLKYFQNTHQQIFRSQLAITGNHTDLHTRKLNDIGILNDQNKIENSQWNLHVVAQLDSKFGKQHHNYSGFKMRWMPYHLGLWETEGSSPLNTLVDEDGHSTLATFYTSSIVHLSSRLDLISGVSMQYFSLNKEFLVEPRLSVSYQLNATIKTGIGYGQHSRLEPLHYYFTTNPDDVLTNNRLRFSKAHHLVGSFQWAPAGNYVVKIEPYYQYLFDIPVTQENQQSFINLENEWFLKEKLSNTGYGRNLGIDFTLEKYISGGVYGLFTCSLFDSKYRNGSSHPWLNTRYNSKIIGNLLFGKEFYLDKKDLKKLSINYRISYQGGSPYTPVHESASLDNGEIIFDHSRPYSQRFAPVFVQHFTINYTVSRLKSNQTISLKVLNAGGYKEFESFRINKRSNQIEAFREALVIPNLSYKFSF